MSLKNQISSDDQARIDAANQAVKSAVAERTALLDELMPKYATLAVGDTIWDKDTGRPAGEVIGLYRVHRGHFEFDAELSVHYEFVERSIGGVRIIGRTSGAPFRFGTREDAERRAERHLEGLRRNRPAQEGQ